MGPTRAGFDDRGRVGGLWQLAPLNGAFDDMAGEAKVVCVTDQQLGAALARSFLAGLPPEVTRELPA